MINKNKVSKFFGNIPIYWINLNDSIDRRDNALRLLTNHPNKRIEAIDGRNEHIFNTSNVVIFKETIGNTNFSAQIKACCCSHIRAIKNAFDDKLDKVCIFEDDFSFDILDKYPHTLQDIINKAPKDWELIQLFYHSTDQVLDNHLKEYKEKGLIVFKPTIRQYGATCYLINRKGMLKVLKNVLTNGINYFKFNIPMSYPEHIVYALPTVYCIVNLSPIIHSKHKTTFNSYIVGSQRIDNLDKVEEYVDKIRKFTASLK